MGKNKQRQQFLVYGTLQKNSYRENNFQKIIRQYASATLVSLSGASMSQPSKSVQEMRQLMKSTFLVSLHTYGDDIITLFRYLNKKSNVKIPVL